MREVLATAMLEALGVDTSKSFSLIETGEDLFRNDEPSPTRSSVLVRLSHSHIRIGSFQRLLAQNDAEGVGRLLAHTVTHYAPEARRNDPVEEAVAFLESVMRKTAATAARWVAAGFVHGVLNTDNINVTARASITAPIASCRSMIRASRPPISTRPVSTLSDGRRTRLPGTVRGSLRRCC